MQQRWDEALVEVRAAVEMAPDIGSSYVRLGDVLVRLQRWNEALEAYETAVQLEPTNVEARYLLGQVLVRTRAGGRRRSNNGTAAWRSTPNNRPLRDAIERAESTTIAPATAAADVHPPCVCRYSS